MANHSLEKFRQNGREFALRTNSEIILHNMTTLCILKEIASFRPKHHKWYADNVFNYFTNRHDAVRKFVLAFRANELRLCDLEVAVRTRRDRFFLFSFVRSPDVNMNRVSRLKQTWIHTGEPRLPDEAFDALLVLEVDLVSVLWTHQHCRVAKTRVPQTRAMTLDNSRRQQVYNICNEERSRLNKCYNE